MKKSTIKVFDINMLHTWPSLITTLLNCKLFLREPKRTKALITYPIVKSIFFIFKSQRAYKLIPLELKVKLNEFFPDTLLYSLLYHKSMLLMLPHPSPSFLSSNRTTGIYRIFYVAQQSKLHSCNDSNFKISFSREIGYISFKQTLL